MKIDEEFYDCTECPYHHNDYDGSWCEKTLEEFDDEFYDKIDNKEIQFPSFCPYVKLGVLDG